MAFGFGFNKQKVLSAAEKFVQQGKLQNAIAEYEKIRKHDDKDLTIANTIGDLYSRMGDSAKAIECFKTVGDAYAAQGFTVKGIAMYKKIAKLAPSVDGSLKLAELYTQQGLFNDARAQYLQVAEDFMKNGDLDQAIRLFQKVLEMDPENVPMRIKLAEVYLKRGKKQEAWEIFSAAAEALRTRGSMAAAEDILQRMLVLDPGNSYVLLMRGKSAVESGDAAKAIEYLEKASDIDSHPDGLRDLLKAYLQNGDLTKAGPLAEKLLTVHNDAEGLFLLAESVARYGHPNDALEIYSRHADRMLATDSAKLLSNLHTMIAQVRDDAGALEKLMGLLRKSGESTHVNEVIELLAHASVKSGNMERARELYAELAKSEPQNSMHLQNYQQVTDRMSGSSPSAPSGLISAEEGSLIVEELEATAPAVDQTYPDNVAIAVRSAVTEADLFLSYNLPDKALAPLMAVLPEAPGDVRLNQRLAALYTRSKRFHEAAVCCRMLETAYHDASHPDEALRYGELATRYERSAVQVATQSAGQTPEPAAQLHAEPASTHISEHAEHGTLAAAAATGAHSGVTASPWPAAETSSHHAATHEDATPEFTIQEMDVRADSGDHDLSSEWEQSLTVEASSVSDDEAISASVGGGTVDAEKTEGEPEGDPSSNPEIAETVDEIHFYLEHFMVDQARAAFEKLQTLTRSAAVLDPLRSELDKGATLPAEPEVEIAELDAGDVASFEVEAEAPDGAEVAAAPELIAHHEPLGGPFAENARAEYERAEAAALQRAAQAAAEQAAADHDAVEVQPAHFEVVPAEEEEATPAFAETFSAEASQSPETTDGEGTVHELVNYADPVPAEVHAETQADASELSALVADLEASLPDVVPGAESVAESAKAGALSAQSFGAQHSSHAAAQTVSHAASQAAAPAAGEKFAGWPVGQPSQPASHEPVPASQAAAITETTPAHTTGASGAAAAPAPTMTYTASPSRPLAPEANAATSPEGVDLSEMFSELRHELEEEAIAGDDDPETHYNMGVAFREMGLLDEAIAELQRVCTAIDRGHAFSQSIQTYTWLAQCFLDKGVPDAAIRWYEKALNIPGLDNESRLALHYELGSACEQAHNKKQALHHFTYVFGANIDYRDVAERIQALSS
ncbi:MAG: tetratricopeptide repeat protein [Terriglobales bacterium]